jgi:hypothetical protein
LAKIYKILFLVFESEKRVILVFQLVMLMLKLFVLLSLFIDFIFFNKNNFSQIKKSH